MAERHNMRLARCEIPQSRVANGETASISILNDIRVWWLQQMTDLLRMPLAARRQLPATALVVAPDAGSSVLISSRQRGREQRIGCFALDAAGRAALRRALSRRERGSPVVLRLPADLLLEREVALPLAAESDVANALRFSIDSLTPFAVDEVCWSWTVLLRDRLRQRLQLRLSLVCKTAVQPLIAALGLAGAPPRLLEFPLSDTESRVIALDSAASRGARLRRHALAAIGGGAAGAVLMLAVLPIALQLYALTAIDGRIETLRPRAMQAVALRSRLADAAGSIDAIAHERATVGDALQAVAIITDALPDNTYLTELSLRQHRLTLSGESGAAAQLIVALSAEPMLRGTQFAAPVTRAPAGGRDVFSIQAELMPGAPRLLQSAEVSQ